MIASAILLFFLGYNKIQYYLLDNSDFARAMLYGTSFVIAREHFPLGSGFGTFGSFISGKIYSPLYYKYGLSNIYGLTENNNSYISDTFWPMILAQFGFLGLILFVAIIGIIFHKIWSIRKLNKYYFLSSMCLMLYLLIASTSESSFVNYYAVYFFIMLGIYLNQVKEMKN